jgi:hypothetical protein
VHDELSDALKHLHSNALSMQPAELIVHQLNGSVENVGPG